MLDYLKELNEAQHEAVIRTEGPSLIIAGAGSGKTRVLTYRIAHLLKQGARPSSILALTFTNKAAREMKERISSVVGENMARYLWMGTFHSVFSKILRAEHEQLGFPSNFTIYDSSDSKNLVKSIIRDFGFDEKTYKPGVVSHRISMAKNSLITPVAYSQNNDFIQLDKSMRMPEIHHIYKEYTKRCFLSGAMDFDDLLLKTNVLFNDFPEVLQKYAQKFDYILVDEYQDTNHAQYLIIKKLAILHNNICVVGDDAQSIYSFRGARIENILNFKSDYPQLRVFKLEQNYRSTKTIVNAANSIISKNKRQIPKTIFSEKETGTPIKIISAYTDNEEGFLVAQEISQTQLAEHQKYLDFAILYRTNAQSRIFEESLRRRNIPYKIYGGLSFYQRKEIKDLLAYFRMIVNPADNEALKRIINYPARGIGQTTVTKLEAESGSAEISMWEAIHLLPGANPAKLNKGTLAKIEEFRQLIENFADYSAANEAYETARYIAEKTGILKELYNDKSPEGLSRHENIEELLNGIQEFSISALEQGEPGKLENYLADVALLTDQDNEKEEDLNTVTLMTIHSAKGLEFKNVFIVGLEENLFPSNQADEFNRIEALEEERRLFYVALTRAREKAWFTFAKQRYKWGKLEFCSPSRFISEIDTQFFDKNSLLQENTGFSEKRVADTPLFNQNSDLQSFIRYQNEASKSVFNRKLEQLKETSKNAEPFEGADPSMIQAGMVVEHQRFGEGKVIKTEGFGQELKATVFFQNAGIKQLLLKFARLKIIR